MLYENRIFALKFLTVLRDFTDFHKGVWGRKSNWWLTCVITGFQYAGHEYNSTTVQQHKVQQYNSTRVQQYNSKKVQQHKVKQHNSTLQQHNNTTAQHYNSTTVQ